MRNAFQPFPQGGGFLDKAFIALTLTLFGLILSLMN